MQTYLPHVITLIIALVGAYVMLRVRQAEDRKDIEYLKAEVKLLRERWHDLVTDVQKIINDLFRNTR